MTYMEFLTNVENGTINEEVIAFAKNAQERHLQANEKRKGKAHSENEPLKLAIIDFIKSQGSAVASVIATNLEISTQKASSLCVSLVKDGRLSADEIKVGKRKVKSYMAVED